MLSSVSTYVTCMMFWVVELHQRKIVPSAWQRDKHWQPIDGFAGDLHLEEVCKWGATPPCSEPWLVDTATPTVRICFGPWSSHNVKVANSPVKRALPKIAASKLRRILCGSHVVSVHVIVAQWKSLHTQQGCSFLSIWKAVYTPTAVSVYLSKHWSVIRLDYMHLT